MQLSQVQYFLESARLLNFTRAAAACGVSQPALSRGIKALEREFGGALLHRAPTVAVTELGRRVMPYLQQLADAAAAARQQAQSLGSGAIVPLAIGLDASVDAARLTPLISELSSLCRGLSVRLETSARAALLTRLVEGGIDLLLRGHDGSADKEPLHRVLLGREEVVAVHPHGHRLQGNGPVNAAVLLSLPDRIRFCETAEALLANTGDAAPFRHAAACPEQLGQMVDAGLGWGLLPADHPVAKARPHRRIAGGGLYRELELVFVAGRLHTRGMASLIRLARQQEARVIPRVTPPVPPMAQHDGVPARM